MLKKCFKILFFKYRYINKKQKKKFYEGIEYKSEHKTPQILKTTVFAA